MRGEDGQAEDGPTASPSGGRPGLSSGQRPPHGADPESNPSPYPIARIPLIRAANQSADRVAVITKLARLVVASVRARLALFGFWKEHVLGRVVGRDSQAHRLGLDLLPPRVPRCVPIH